MKRTSKPKYGWKPDLTDHRDKIFKLGSPPDFSDLPKKVDLRPWCSRIENQYSIGSCTANASVGALEYLEIKAGNSSSFEDLSRLFVYYNTRELEGNLGQDCGATIRNTIKILVSSGSCGESIWPYSIEKCNDKPLIECYDSAKNHLVTEYQRINSFEDMIHCLADGYPFVFGFSVFSEFEGPTVAQTGILNLPTSAEICQGGHAVLAVGYDMETKTFLVRNSWGPNWGIDGYFTIPFAYITNPNLAQDMWCIKK